jgi:hypothetical protein
VTNPKPGWKPDQDPDLELVSEEVKTVRFRELDGTQTELRLPTRTYRRPASTLRIRRAGLPQAEIDGLDGLAPLPDSESDA